MIDGKYSPKKDPDKWIPFPSLFGSSWYKKFAQFFADRVARATGFRPRLYSLEEYLLVVIYSLLKRWSIHNAAERLNRQAALQFRKHHKRYPKVFRDGRRRRHYPHQTSVNNLIASLSPSFVEETFQEYFLVQLEEALQGGLISPNLRLLVDNTRYAYYGGERTPYTIKYHKFLGTDVGRFYQGVLVVTNGVALFTRFSALAKGRSRVAKIRDDVAALQARGFTILRALMDRAFYRTLLVKDLKALGVPVIIPAVQHSRVRRRYRHFLRGRMGLVQPFNISQTSRKYHSQRAVRVRLAIIGKDDRDPRAIRAACLPTPRGMRSASKELRAFVTTIPPWKHPYNFTRYLCREYKIRWRIESAFRDLNKFAPNWRTNHLSSRLFYFGTCAVLYNVWQLRAKTRQKHENRLAPVVQALVVDEMTREVVAELERSKKGREEMMEENHWKAYEFDEKLYA